MTLFYSVIKEMLRLEKAIDKCIRSLNETINNLSPDNDWDDVESITSATTSRHRTLGARRENELLKLKVHSLELENLEMKKQLESIQKKSGLEINELDLTPGSPTPPIEFVKSPDRISKRIDKRAFWKKDQKST